MNEQSDNGNCGACNQPCPTNDGYTCQAGSCACPSGQCGPSGSADVCGGSTYNAFQDQCCQVGTQYWACARIMDGQGYSCCPNTFGVCAVDTADPSECY